MKHLRLQDKEVLLVEALSTVKNPFVYDMHGTRELIYWGINRHPVRLCELPPGNWQLLGLCPEISEEQWKEIVQKADWWNGTSDVRFIDYEHAHCGPFYRKTASESARSLLSREGYNWGTTLILKKYK